MVEIIDGDIVRATEQYICHQCNCVTNRAAHLAAYVFQHFPYADVYKGRSFPHQPGPGGMPGDIVIRGNGGDQRLVIAMLGQYYPGKPRFPESKRDGFEARRSYFGACLDKIARIPGLESLAFPYQVGCGAAGGDWAEYFRLIEKMASGITARVVIYKLNTGLYKKIVDDDQFEEQDVPQEP